MRIKGCKSKFMFILACSATRISEDRLANILSNPQAVAYFQTLDVLWHTIFIASARSVMFEHLRSN